MTISIDIERVDTFCNLFFSALAKSSLLPTDGRAHFRDYGEWIRYFVARVSKVGLEAGWLEFFSKALKIASEKELEPFLAVQEWLKENRDLFDRHTLEHLERSSDGRGFGFVVGRELLTPAEAAEETGTSESSWRNRAAAGEIPGAFKKGKQWLIPRSAVVTVESEDE